VTWSADHVDEHLTLTILDASGRVLASTPIIEGSWDAAAPGGGVQDAHDRTRVTAWPRVLGELGYTHASVTSTSANVASERQRTYANGVTPTIKLNGNGSMTGLNEDIAVCPHAVIYALPVARAVENCYATAEHVTILPLD